MSNARTNNDYLRSQLSKSLDELQQLEDKGELILSFSNGICMLMKRNGGAHPLLEKITGHKINREFDPFADGSGGMLDYGSSKTKIFFKITHQQNTAYIDFGLYSEINVMRRQRRDKYIWFSLKAIADF